MTQDQRFGRLIERRDGLDFPYYLGTPVAITGSRWLVVMAAVVLGFVALVMLPLTGPVLQFVPAIVFAGLPLVALGWASSGHWRSLFHRVGARDVGLMVLFAVLNIVVTFVAGLLVSVLFGASANPEAGKLAAASPRELVLFYPRTAIQLLGEELLTILPFLALLWLLVSRLGWTRNQAVIAAWVVTAIGFGLVHLPTYGWNLPQCLLVIGLARIVLTLAYIRTKNLWVSTGAHVLNDWALFSFPVILAALRG